MNSINLTGRLTADPELKKTTTNISVCSFTVAVKRPHVKDTTDFIDVTAWRQAAEYIANFGRKGGIVEISGVLTTRKFEDKNGNKRTAYEVSAETLSILDRGEPKEVKETATETKEDMVAVTNEDDLPF